MFWQIFVNLIACGASDPSKRIRKGRVVSDAEGSRIKGRVPARAAVTELFQVHYRRLVGLAVLLVDDRETAEDVVQEAFEGLYRRWRRLRDPQAASTYLNRSVVNGCRSRLRRRATERAHPLAEVGQAPSAESTGVTHSAGHALVDAVRTLSRRQREVVVLRTTWTCPKTRSPTGSVSAPAR